MVVNMEGVQTKNRLRVYKHFSCSSQLSIKFQPVLESQLLNNNKIILLKTLRCCVYFVFILLINVKMPTFVGILTFMSRINFMLSWVEHEQSLKLRASWRSSFVDIGHERNTKLDIDSYDIYPRYFDTLTFYQFDLKLSTWQPDEVFKM